MVRGQLSCESQCTLPNFGETRGSGSRVPIKYGARCSITPLSRPPEVPWASSVRRIQQYPLGLGLGSDILVSSPTDQSMVLLTSAATDRHYG